MSYSLFIYDDGGKTDPIFGAIGEGEVEVVAANKQKLEQINNTHKGGKLSWKEIPLVYRGARQGDIVYSLNPCCRGTVLQLVGLACLVKWDNGNRSIECDLVIEGERQLTEDEILAAMDYAGERVASLHDAQLEHIEAESDYNACIARAKEAGLNDAQAKLVQKYFVRMVLKATGRS